MELDFQSEQFTYRYAGPATFTYDANGNLTSDGSTSFVYDAENRLVSASGARTAAMSYDPLGRLWQVIGPQRTTRFTYDGDALIGEWDGVGTLRRRYVHGTDSGADDSHNRFSLAPGIEVGDAGPRLESGPQPSPTRGPKGGRAAFRPGGRPRRGGIERGHRVTRSKTCLAGAAAGAIAIAGAAAASETTTFTYDALGRLVAVSTGGGPNNGLNVGTCYDRAGNRSTYSVGTGTPPPPCPPPPPPPPPPPQP